MTYSYLCNECENDGHSNHVPSLGGICIGCVCPETPKDGGDAT
jgi:hypothetical protein